MRAIAFHFSFKKELWAMHETIHTQHNDGSELNPVGLFERASTSIFVLHDDLSAPLYTTCFYSVHRIAFV